MREEPKSLAEWLESQGNPKHVTAEGENGSMILVVDDGSSLENGITIFGFREYDFGDRKSLWMSSGWGLRREYLPALQKFLKEESAETTLSKYEYIRLCVGSDTLILKKDKAELQSLFEAWHSGNKPESEYAPGELMTYEDFQLKVFSLSNQIYIREKILSEAPGSYEAEWEEYQQNNTKAVPA